MATILFHPKQVAAVVEVSEGTRNATVAATDLIRVIQPVAQFTPQSFPRDLARRSFGAAPAHYSTGTGQITFTVEITGRTDNTSAYATPPQWDRLLAACGCDSTQIGVVGTGTITSGPIEHNDVITAGLTATAFGYTYTGEGAAVVRKAAGALTAGAATVAPSGASFTLASPLGNTLYGHGWAPITKETTNATLTLYLNNDGQRYVMYGCRGNVRVNLAAHDRGLLEFTFFGIYYEVAANAMVTELGANTFEDLTPPAFFNVGSSLTPQNLDGSFGTAISGADFCWSEASFDLGNNVVVRPCVNGANGFMAAVITGRSPTFTINPDDPGVASYAYIAKMMAGTRARIDMAWSNGVTGNSFRLSIPHLQTVSTTMGERDARTSHQVTFACTLGQTDGAAGAAIGTDNEFRLLNY